MRTCKFFPRLLLAVFRRVSANYSLSFILLAESSGTQWDPRQLYPFASTFDACVFKSVIPACIKPAIDFLPFWVCPLSNTNNKTICFLQTLATQLISSLSDIFLQTREVAVCVKISMGKQFLKYLEQLLWHQQPWNTQSVEYPTSAYHPISCLPQI